MIIFEQSAAKLKRFIGHCQLNEYAQKMVMRIVLCFIFHRGRMSCSAAAGVIASLPLHRGQLTRFLARPRWQESDINDTLRKRLIEMESGTGPYLFIVDGTMISQAGKKTENTYSTGNRKRRKIKKGFRYNKNKVTRKYVHNFTFGLLITPSGVRIPFQMPHYTEEYSEQYGIERFTTAEAAAEMIRDLPLPDSANVIVLGDTAYDAKVVRAACDERGYKWVFPANAERVYQGPKGQRPRLRTRLKDWAGLSLKKIRLRASKGKYVEHRRISRWRLGSKQKPREYFAYQEKQEVRSVGCVQIVFSTMKPELKKATPDDVKILMTNATEMSVTEVLDVYTVRWQIELFFKELKSTLHMGQYSFMRFKAVEAWINCAITTVLYLEQTRAQKMKDRRLSADRKRWWKMQRLHGLTEAVRQECLGSELNFMSQRIKTSGGVEKLKRLIHNALPVEYRPRTI